MKCRIEMLNDGPLYYAQYFQKGYLHTSNKSVHQNGPRTEIGFGCTDPLSYVKESVLNLLFGQVVHG